MPRLIIALAGACLWHGEALLQYHGAEDDAARARLRATCGAGAARREADPTASAVRVATFMAAPTRGGSVSSNYFHFFFGALVPFVHWAAREAAPTDVLIMNDVDPRPARFIPAALSALRPALCVKALASARGSGANDPSLRSAGRVSSSASRSTGARPHVV